MQQVGSYIIDRELARGGMGVVFVGHHESLQRPVAIKLLRASRASKRGVKRLETEARVVAQLQHPNIVKVHDFGFEGGDPFIVMELIDGESLAEKVAKSGPLPPLEAARHVEALACGLAHAHEHGVLHRDIKPDNVLLSKDGRILLTDFGLAKDLAEERERMTLSGQLLGTPTYMPPEQAAGRAHDVDPRSDTYALGATLYTLLTGEPPFDGGELLVIIQDVISRSPKAPREWVPSIPAGLEAVCVKAMQKDPDQRYATATELGDDLRRCLAGRSPLAQPRTWGALQTTMSALVILAVAVAVAAAVANGLSSAQTPAPPTVNGGAQADPAAPSEAGAGDVNEDKAASAWRSIARGDRAAVKAWLGKYSGTRFSDEAADVLLSTPILTVDVEHLVVAYHLEDRILAVTGRTDTGLSPVRARLHTYTTAGAPLEALDAPSLEYGVRSSALAPMRRRLAVGTRDSKLLVLGLRRSVISSIGSHRSDVRALFYLGPAKLLVAPKGDDVYVAELTASSIPGAQAAARVATIPTGGKVLQLAGSLKADRCVTFTSTNQGQLWQLGRRGSAPQRVADLESRLRVDAVAFASGGEVFAAGNAHGGVAIFDSKTGERLRRLGEPIPNAIPAGSRAAHTTPVVDLAFTSDGSALITLSRGNAHRNADLAKWDWRTGALIARRALSGSEYRMFHPSPTGEELLLTCAGSERFEIWAAASLFPLEQARRAVR